MWIIERQPNKKMDGNYCAEGRVTLRALFVTHRRFWGIKTLAKGSRFYRINQTTSIIVVVLDI